MKIRRRIITIVLALVMAYVACVALLTLAGPFVGNVLFFNTNWVESVYDSNSLGNVGWSTTSAVSPDGRNIAAIETESIGGGQSCTLVRVRDAASKEIRATIWYTYASKCNPSWIPSRIAWVDASTVAIYGSGYPLFLWRWEAFVFPFGLFWLIVWGVIAAFVAGGAAAISLRYRARAS